MRSARARLRVTTLAVLCALTAGCTAGTDGPGAGAGTTSPATPSSPTTSPATSPATAEPVTLRFWVYGDPAAVAAYEKLAAAFSRQSPQVTVEVRGWDDAAQLATMVQRASASGRAPDVFVVDRDHLPRLVDQGEVQPVDGLLEERRVDFGDGYHRDGLEAFAAAAALQCMPHDVSPTVVYYNEELVDLAALAEEGEEPPTAEDGWTFEQFATAARRAARGKAKGVYLAPTLDSLAPFVWSASADIVDDDSDPTRLTLSEDGPREALEQVLALVRDPQVTPTRQELARRSALQRFTGGDLGMLLGTRDLVPQLRKAEDLDFEVMPLPSLGVYRTLARMSGYCLAAGTEHAEEAADLVAFAVSREGASITAAPGDVVPSNLEVAHSAAFAQPGLQPSNEFVFTEGVRRSQAMPFVAEWAGVEEQVDPLLRRLFHAPVIDLDTLLAEIDQAAQQVLAPGEPFEQ